MIKVAIVEDIKMIRDGLKILINGNEDFSLTGAYESVEDLLDEIADKTPNVILMDIQLPGISGIEGVKRVKNKYSKTSCIMLTVHEDNKNIFEALMAGATGYLLKTTPPSQIVDAIKDASEGGSPMNSNIANKVINLMKIAHLDKLSQNKVELSERETEILQKIANGTGYKNIADELFISIHTVRYHIRNIYEKLQVHNQSEAVSKAFKQGLI
ncbi:MAG: response regulator transcription factor [Ignavibacteriales bacterium]|nr:response regulator transcription factor [Ignavibacteriales bacterium]